MNDMLDAVIFDLDGTLIDTPRAIVEMMRDTMTSMGLPPTDTAKIMSMIGLPLEDGVASFLDKPVNHPDVAEFVRRYKARFHEWLVPQAKTLLFPNVRSGLQDLRTSGRKLGVATSKHRASAEAILRSAGIWDLFQSVVGADCVSKPKPDPEMALMVADKLKCAPQNCLMVGDTLHDLNMGRAAQMRTCGVTYGVESAPVLAKADVDFVANNFMEMVDFALKNGKN